MPQIPRESYSTTEKYNLMSKSVLMVSKFKKFLSKSVAVMISILPVSIVEIFLEQDMETFVKLVVQSDWKLKTININACDVELSDVQEWFGDMSVEVVDEYWDPKYASEE